MNRSPFFLSPHWGRCTAKLELIHFQRHGRTPDSIFLDLREAQLQPHLCQRAREATEVASQSPPKSDLPFGRMLVRQQPRTQYADSWGESDSETESGAWRETQCP